MLYRRSLTLSIKMMVNTWRGSELLLLLALWNVHPAWKLTSPKLKGPPTISLPHVLSFCSRPTNNQYTLFQILIWAIMLEIQIGVQEDMYSKEKTKHSSRNLTAATPLLCWQIAPPGSYTRCRHWYWDASPGRASGSPPQTLAAPSHLERLVEESRLSPSSLMIPANSAAEKATTHWNLVVSLSTSLIIQVWLEETNLIICSGPHLYVFTNTGSMSIIGQTSRHQYRSSYWMNSTFM